MFYHERDGSEGKDIWQNDAKWDTMFGVDVDTRSRSMSHSGDPMGVCWYVDALWLKGVVVGHR